MRGFHPAEIQPQQFANGGPVPQKPQKKRGMVKGPGTGTSDEVPDQVSEGTYIMPADSTQAIGPDALAGAGGFNPEDAQAASGKQIPVQLSNGEYKLPPEQVHAVGVQALNQAKAATHTPVASGFQPEQAQHFFADGGVVTDEERRRRNSFGDASAAHSNAGVTGPNVRSPASAAAIAQIPSQDASGPAPVTPAPVQPQTASDRAAIGSAWDTAKGASEDAGRALADVAALPLRGVVGAYDSTVVRGMRAAGLNAGYLSPHLVPNGVDPASMTPFTDQKRLSAGAAPLANASGAAPATPPTVPAAAAAVPPGKAAGAAPDPATPAPTAAAAAGGLPAGVTQPQPGVFRKGNSYSDSVAGLNGVSTAAIPSASAAGFNPAAAATAMGGPQQNDSVSAPTVAHSGNDWAERNRLRNLAVSANSITNNGGRFDERRDGRGRMPSGMGMSPDQAAYMEAIKADEGARGQQAGLESTAMQQSGLMKREGVQQAGANARAALSESGQNARANSTNALAAGRDAFDQQVKGFDVRAAQQQEALRGRYDAAKTPAEREAIAKQIRDMAGKAETADWGVQVTPATKNADGSTTEGSVIRYNKRTGETEQVQSGKAKALPPGMTKQVGTKDGRPVYEDANGKQFVG